MLGEVDDRDGDAEAEAVADVAAALVVYDDDHVDAVLEDDANGVGAAGNAAATTTIARRSLQ